MQLTFNSISQYLRETQENVRIISVEFSKRARPTVVNQNATDGSQIRSILHNNELADNTETK